MKKLFSVTVLVMVLSLFTAGNLFASPNSANPWLGVVDSISFVYNHGEDYMFPDSLRGEHALNNVNRYGFAGEMRGEKWGLELRLLYSAHKADEVPDHGQDTGFKVWEGMLGVNRYFLPGPFEFSIGVFAGLGYIDEFPRFENRDWPDRSLESNIGQSHVVGRWGLKIQKDILLYSTSASETSG